jgi:hypothetical protein
VPQDADHRYSVDRHSAQVGGARRPGFFCLSVESAFSLCDTVVLMRCGTVMIGLLLTMAVGCSAGDSLRNESRAAPSKTSGHEGLAFPRSTVGASAPRFLSGDSAEADAGPNDWVMVALNQKSEEDKYVVYGYVHRGEDSSHWSKFFSYMNGPRPDEPPLAFMVRQKLNLEKKCPGAIFAVSKESETEITYESKVAKCPLLGNQDEIVRVIYGQLNLFRLSYTVHSTEMSAQQRADALKLLSEFQLRE